MTEMDKKGKEKGENTELKTKRRKSKKLANLNLTCYYLKTLNINLFVYDLIYKLTKRSFNRFFHIIRSFHYMKAKHIRDNQTVRFNSKERVLVLEVVNKFS